MSSKEEEEEGEEDREDFDLVLDFDRALDVDRDDFVLLFLEEDGKAGKSKEEGVEDSIVKPFLSSWGFSFLPRLRACDDNERD